MKKLSFDDFWEEVEKLKRRAEKINKTSRRNMVVVVYTHIKKK